MTVIARLRKVLILPLALAVTAGTLTILPATIAHAATDNSSSTLLRYIDNVRAANRDKLARNEYLTEYAQAWAAKLAKANGGEGSTVAAANKPLPPIDANGTAPTLASVQCVDNKNAGTATDYGIRYCLRYDYDFFAAPDSLNYVAIGVVETSTKTFAVMVLAGYPDGAPRKLVSAVPTIVGTGRVGQALTVDVGSWSPTTKVTFTYAWRINGATVATSKSFTPQAEHAGSAVTVQVTGTRAGFWSPRNPRESLPTTITTGTMKPGTVTVSGSRNVGETLTASSTPWSPAHATLTYRWYRSGVLIAGQTGSSYSLTTDDLGKIVNVRVTATAPGYASASVTSTSTVVTVGRLLTATPTPTISGTAKFGATLTAIPGEWGPAPVALSYRWYINSTRVDGATASTFVVPASAVGKTVTVRVYGSKEGFATQSRASLPTATIASLPFTTVGTPTISGSTVAGRTLTAQPGTWSPAATFTYRWYRNGVAISGATASTYVTTSTDRAASVTVRVVGRYPGYTATAVVSAPVGIR